MNCHSELEGILTETTTHETFEIVLGQNLDFSFKHGLTEEEIKPILSYLIERYGNPHYHRSATLYQNDLEYSNYGKYPCQQRTSTRSYVLDSCKDIQITQTNYKTYPLDKFPRLSNYQHLEIIENSIFNVGSNIKCNVYHSYDPSADSFTQVFYSVKIVYYHNPKKVNINKISNELSQCIEKIWEIFPKKQ